MITASNDKQSYPIPVASAAAQAPNPAKIPRLPKELLKSSVFLLKREELVAGERAAA